MDRKTRKLLLCFSYERVDKLYLKKLEEGIKKLINNEGFVSVKITGCCLRKSIDSVRKTALYKVSQRQVLTDLKI